MERIDKSYSAVFQMGQDAPALFAAKIQAGEMYKSFTLKQAGWKLLGDNRISIQGRVYRFIKSREIDGLY